MTILFKIVYCKYIKKFIYEEYLKYILKTINLYNIFNNWNVKFLKNISLTSYCTPPPMRD